MGAKQEFEAYRTLLRSVKVALRYETEVSLDPLASKLNQVVGPAILEIGTPILYLEWRLLAHQSPQSITTFAERIIKSVSDRNEKR